MVVVVKTPASQNLGDKEPKRKPRKESRKMLKVAPKKQPENGRKNEPKTQKKTTVITGRKMYETSRGAPGNGHLGRAATQWWPLQRSSSIKFIFSAAMAKTIRKGFRFGKPTHRLFARIWVARSGPMS